MSRTYFGGICA